VKVGKTTFGQQLGAHVAMGRPFVGRETVATRVLVLALEDPPEYTAWIARHLNVERGRMIFHRRPLILGATDLLAISETIAQEQFGLVLIASWPSGRSRVGPRRERQRRRCAGRGDDQGGLARRRSLG
jgi:hypothetical protein